MWYSKNPLILEAMDMGTRNNPEAMDPEDMKEPVHKTTSSPLFDLPVDSEHKAKKFKLFQ